MASLLSAPLLIKSEASEQAEIIDWHKDLLKRTTPPVELQWEPVKIGPTWQWDNGWVLPERTLGWEVLAWCGQWLQGKKGPWQFTPEQTRFVLWFFALDDDAQFRFHSAVLQRLEGWGKDPMLATLAVGHMFGPTLFSH